MQTDKQTDRQTDSVWEHDRTKLAAVKKMNRVN